MKPPVIELVLPQGQVAFEFSVEVTSAGADHWPVINKKGSRKALPRDEALRKQAQGLGQVVGSESPVATTMADLVNRDPLAPREPVA